jgi:hypothetical protein
LPERAFTGARLCFNKSKLKRSVYFGSIGLALVLLVLFLGGGQRLNDGANKDACEISATSNQLMGLNSGELFQSFSAGTPFSQVLFPLLGGAVFHQFNEGYMLHWFSQLSAISKNCYLPLTVKDIIFPFHYFW